jgi:HK97 family phage major capsid protein
MRQRRAELVARMRVLVDGATAESRDMSDPEGQEFDRLDLEQGRLAEHIARADPQAPIGPIFAGRTGLRDIETHLVTRLPGSGLRPMPTGQRAPSRPGEVRLLAPSEFLQDHVDDRLPDGIQPHAVSFGRAVCGLVTGSWRGRDAEQRVMATSAIGSGGALMPSVLSARVIDAARAAAVVFRAGAQTLPMDAAEVNLARVAQDPVPSWKGENQPAMPSDVALERLALRARTLVGLVKASVELIEDAPNAGDVIETTLAAALALELDRAALRGQSDGGGATMPLGIRGTSGVNLVAVSGLVDLDDFSAAVERITTLNGPSEGLSVIMNPRTWGSIDRMKDGEGLPVRGPASWEALRKFQTTSIPITLAPGTATEPLLGFFPSLVVGMRTELQIEASRVAADSDGSAFRNLQVWIRAYLRADVLVTRETWFSVLTGVTN